jgi:hypothetical protein
MLRRILGLPTDRFTVLCFKRASDRQPQRMVILKQNVENSPSSKL